MVVLTAEKSKSKQNQKELNISYIFEKLSEKKVKYQKGYINANK
jgi:hypothetical protein